MNLKTYSKQGSTKLYKHKLFFLKKKAESESPKKGTLELADGGVITYCCYNK